MSLAIGIDAGGTKLAAALVDVCEGRAFDHCVRPTRREQGGDAVLADCVELAKRAAGAQAVAWIGLGVPELVSPEGAITSAANWDWRDGRWQAALGAIAPVRVESDVRAAALAEARFGAGQGLSSFLYVTIGTGVSHSFVIDGTPWRGARGNAIVSGAPPVEIVASGSALAARAGKGRAEDVLAAAEDEAIVEDAVLALGIELGRLVNALDPEAVLIGGGLGLTPGFSDRIAALMRPQIYAETTREVPVLRSSLGVSGGVIGAAVAAVPAR